VDRQSSPRRRALRREASCRGDFSRVQKLVVTGSNGELFLWDISGLRTQQGVQLIRQLSGHTSVVRAVIVGRDGSKFASAGEDRTVRLWSLPNGEMINRLDGHQQTVYSLAFSPDEDRIVSASGDETICLWDVQTGACLHTLRAEGPYAGLKIGGGHQHQRRPEGRIAYIGR